MRYLAQIPSPDNNSPYIHHKSLIFTPIPFDFTQISLPHLKFYYLGVIPDFSLKSSYLHRF